MYFITCNDLVKMNIFTLQLSVLTHISQVEYMCEYASTCVYLYSACIYEYTYKHVYVSV